MLTHEAFVNVLKTRYDHLSAPIMAKEILANAGLEQKDKYEKDDLGKVLQAIQDMGDPRSEVLVTALEDVLGGGKKDEKKDEKKDDKKDDKKDEKKDEKKDDKKDEKKDEKKDDKKGGKKK